MNQIKKFKVEYWNSEYAVFTREITIEAFNELDAKQRARSWYGINLIESVKEIL